MTKKILVLTFALFFSKLYAETIWTIDYYGVFSDNLDKNMADMTSELYYTQLCEIKNFQVTDKRTSIPSNNIPPQNFFSDRNLSFYTEIIQENESGKWITIIHLINRNENSELTSKKEYDSYYKILMESKSDLQKSFIALIQNNSLPEAKDSFIPPQTKNLLSASTENLAGTWQGEQNIEKILIMRGGRGFIIFKNGASMNISVKVENSLITVSQTGKPNASFFPELPRITAAEAALTADPITWEMYLIGENTLKGTKNTLIPNGETAVQGTVNVEWVRKL
ncbi:MAG: hypothetical protein HUK25_04955 [Treponema sp.]|nr:hypothetical protein [Treponema sp.]